jgi:hypothetical protein
LNQTWHGSIVPELDHLETLYDRVVKTARKVIGPLLAVLLGIAFYLPKEGQAALDELFEQYRRCDKVIIDWAPTPSGEFPSNGCFERYMERREQILWRYFFVQTLATHL